MPGDAPDAFPLSIQLTADQLDEYAASAPARVALLLGTEGDGLSHSALEAADKERLAVLALDERSTLGKVVVEVR